MTIDASWIGTLPTWILVFAVVGIAALVIRGQLGPAIGYLRDANTTLKEENAALRSKLEGATRMISDLEARTDLSPLQAAMIHEMQAHDRRAQERADKTLAVLGMIADRLGPNGEQE